MKELNILFITRNFPPQVGGLENFSFHLFHSLSKMHKLSLIKWSGSKKILPAVFIYFLIKSYLILLLKKIDLVYLTDGVLSLLIPFLKIFKKPVAVTIHGLDITFNNYFYQLLIPYFLNKADKIICVSRATKKECLKRGVFPQKIEVIPNGINNEFFLKEDKKILKERFEKRFNIEIKNKKIILSVGRLVERKGIHWFIKEVLPLILKNYSNFIYLIVGEGKLKKKIEEITEEKDLKEYVILLGKIKKEDLKLVYNIADVFVMPNIKVEGDLEGFGIVLLEAASCNLSIVASDIEGIKDALLEGRLGKLVKFYDSKAFSDEILKILKGNSFTGEDLRRLVKENFSWQEISKRYSEVFYYLINESSCSN
ncbi:hypothetical protein DRN69_07080 [Candidatus Pacearchaeota archaeon]|nr:MAG: hypothetical protein DRN69_07080 [Candidatus Pacearchaeota archaeon]